MAATCTAQFSTSPFTLCKGGSNMHGTVLLTAISSLVVTLRSALRGSTSKDELMQSMLDQIEYNHFQPHAQCLFSMHANSCWSGMWL